MLFIGVLYFALNNPFSQYQKTIGQPMMPQNNGYQGSQVGTQSQQVQGGNQENGMIQQGFGNYQGQQGQQNQRNNFQQSGGPQ